MHEIFMQHALELAEKGWGTTMPNPMVGCVIVHEGKIIGKGFHTAYGKPHAEVEAIQYVTDKSLLKNAILYVNLEPCNHFGKTPPCSDLILEHKIPEVIICNLDPNPLVSGSGIKKLQDHGVQVTIGVLKEKGEFLNRRFFTFHQKKRPYIILKWAQTQDGFIDKIRYTSNPIIHKITGKKSHELSHQWRSEEAGILAGKNTIKNDNPFLTVRETKGKNPVRIVLDKNLECNLSFNVFNADASTIVFNSKKDEKNQYLHFIKMADFSLSEILSKLHTLNLQSILIEGGAFTLNQFIQSNLWDEARVFTSKETWVEGLKAPEFNFTESEISIIENDTLKIYYNL